jgi:transcriptional regulator with XRE-family HTH domain
MELTAALPVARARAGLTLRSLAGRAHTSHATLAAYEHRRKVPSTTTLVRVVAAAGFDLTVALTPRPGGVDPAERGRELADVLDLAAQFPARHARTLTTPVFGRP